MKTFKDLIHDCHHYGGGTQALIFFKNGYGMSVVRTASSYGGNEGLYEIAIAKGSKGSREMCYNTKITDDVLGYLTPKEITHFMERIQAL